MQISRLVVKSGVARDLLFERCVIQPRFCWLGNPEGLILVKLTLFQKMGRCGGLMVSVTPDRAV